MRSSKKSRLASADAARDVKQRGKISATEKSKPTPKSKGLELRFKKAKIKNDDITFIFRNLSTLLENGVSLPKAIGALADERGMEAARETLTSLRKALEMGATFSAAMAKHPDTFDTLTVNQVKVGERASSLGDALGNIAAQREKAGKLRGEIVKKLA